MRIYFKKGISLLLSLVFVLSLFASHMVVFAAPTEPEITAFATVDNDAGTVSLTFSVGDNPGYNQFRLPVKPLPGVLEYSEIVAGAVLLDHIENKGGREAFPDVKWNGMLTFANPTTNGTADIIFYNGNETTIPYENTAQGEIFTIIYNIVEGVGPGDYSFTVGHGTGTSTRNRWGGGTWTDLSIKGLSVPFTIGDAGATEPDVLITDIAFADAKMSVLRTGGDVQLAPTITPADASSKSLEWTSSDTAVATVSTTGLVTPRTNGTTTIRATATDGSDKYDEITVTVGESVTGVYYGYTDRYIKGLKVGETFTFNPSIMPLDAADKSVTYYGYDTDIVTFDANGVMTAAGVGKTIVWVKTNDGDFTCPMQVWVLADDSGDGGAASVGGREYATLIEATEAAKTGEIITLLKDQECGETVVLNDGVSLNLGGYTLYALHIQIPEGATVPSIENGTLVTIPYSSDNYSSSMHIATIMLFDGATLKNLNKVEFIHVGGNTIYRSPIGLFRTGYETVTAIERFENCVVNAYWVDAIISSAADAPGIIYNDGGVVKYVNDNVITGNSCAFQWCGTTQGSDAFVHGGTFNLQRMNMLAGSITIYGGDFSHALNPAHIATGYTAKLVGGRYIVERGGAPGTLTLAVTPADATVKLEKIDGTTKTVVNPSGGTYPVEIGFEYEYTVSASGYTTKTGKLPISFAETDVKIDLVATSSDSGGGTTTPSTTTVKGGDFITAGGTYQLEAPKPGERYGVVTVATQDAVTIIGHGTSDSNKMFRDLTIDCASGVNLTIQDLWINNNAGQGTASGPTNMGVNILNFTGKGNTLRTVGTCLLENQDYVQGAGIHVPPGAELTFDGYGTLYLYKYSQGCGIGGNANEASGEITFKSGNYFIKGSKTGAVIGGDAAGSAKNGDIRFDGANVVVINEAMGDAIGESNNATCGGDVYITAGNLTTITLWRGDAISARGTMYYTGGSYKPIMTSNALTGSGNTHFVNDNAVRATKLSNDKPASLLVFKTDELLGASNKTSFDVTLNSGVKFTVGLHEYEYSGANTTIASFARVPDRNLYFYLPTEGSNTLTVDTKTFTVKWDDAASDFTVTEVTGGSVGGTDSTNNESSVYTNTPPLASDPDRLVTVTPPTTPITNGETTATVAKETLDKAIEEAAEGKKDGIAIAPRNIGDATKVTIELPKTSAEAISDAKLSLVVKTPIGDLTFESDSVAAIVSGAGSGETVQIIVEAVDANNLSDAQRDAIGDRSAVDLKVKSGGVTISSFGNGRVIVTIPYELRDGELAEGLKVFHVAADGTRTEIPCTYNRAIKSIVFVVNHFSVYVIDYDATAVWANPFSDVRDTDWFYDAVKFVSSQGLMNGTGADKFAPTANLTRAMLVTVLYRYEGEPTVSGSGGFTDVPSGQWYTDAIAWAAANGIVNGVGDEKFDPNGNITREQLATILHRYTTLKGGDVTVTTDLAHYTDAAEISTWATDAMLWANASGLITGRSATTLAPKGTATRAEVATILMRYIGE